jgi:isoleucyl-tRNA synthetase
MVRERGDWCISRQRTWGVPIPVFYHRDTGEVLLNSATLAHIQALIAEHGADVWWERDEAGLLPEPHVAEAAQWRKGTDTMDVWFDSGSSWAGVLGGIAGSGGHAADLRYPADLYLEGSDQHRGWFQSSLLTSVAVNGTAPYRRVLTHGFTLDEKGRKMSKSLGNVVDPAVLVEGGKNEKQDPAYGADVLRLWVSSVDYSADVPLGPGIVKQLADVYRKVRNTARYLLGNLHDFDPRPIAEGGHAIAVTDLPLLDRWMLDRMARLIEEVTGYFGVFSAQFTSEGPSFEFYRFYQALQNFCVVDLSNFYLDIAKDRLYVSGATAFRRRSCQTVLSLVVERLAGLIAPVLCHMAEDIWQNLPYPVAETSVFERGWPRAPDSWSASLSTAEITAVRDARDLLRPMVNRLLEDCRKGAAGLGASLEAQVQIALDAHQDGGQALAYLLDALAASPHPEVDNLADWLLVSQLTVAGDAPDGVLAEASENGVTVRVARAAGEKCERCWHYEPDVADHQLSDGVGGRICGRCRQVLEPLQAGR